MRYPGHQNAHAGKMAIQSETTVDGNNFGENNLYCSITPMPVKIGGLAGGGQLLTVDNQTQTRAVNK